MFEKNLVGVGVEESSLVDWTRSIAMTLLETYHVV